MVRYKMAISSRKGRKPQAITIKNDQNRLSKEDIDKMVQEAEKFKEDDDRVKEKIRFINNFESLLYQTKSSIIIKNCLINIRRRFKYHQRNS